MLSLQPCQFDQLHRLVEVKALQTRVESSAIITSSQSFSGRDRENHPLTGPGAAMVRALAQADRNRRGFSLPGFLEKPPAPPVDHLA
jgi:hypothetical protein